MIIELPASTSNSPVSLNAVEHAAAATPTDTPRLPLPMTDSPRAPSASTASILLRRTSQRRSLAATGESSSTGAAEPHLDSIPEAESDKQTPSLVVFRDADTEGDAESAETHRPVDTSAHSGKRNSQTVVGMDTTQSAIEPLTNSLLARNTRFYDSLQQIMASFKSMSDSALQGLRDIANLAPRL
jgi:hypothetical protein